MALLKLTKAERLAIYIRDRFICTICGRNLKQVGAKDITLGRWQEGDFDTVEPPNNLFTVCKGSCSAGDVLSTYRRRMTRLGFSEEVQKRLNRSINIPVAKKALVGMSERWPNPWSLGKSKGLLRKDSTVKGNKNIARTTRLAIYIRDNYSCLYCGKPLHKERAQNITLNCFIPYPDGLKIPENLVTCCRDCSRRKRSKNWDEKLKKLKKLEFVENQLNKDIKEYRKVAKDVLSGKNTKLVNPWLTE